MSAPDAPAMRTIAYNSDNMPAQIAHSAHGTTTFTYDGGGSRAKKSGPSGSTYYVGGHFEVSGGSAKKYIFAGSQRVAMIDAGGQIYYFHSDHLGSSAVLTDPTGIKAQQTDYLPYGGQRGASSISASNYGFTNQEKDPETGLYNYNARLYDPATAVFVTADSIVPNSMSVMGFQRYGYCNGNPLIYTDPSGHYGVAETVYIAMAIAAVLGAGNAAAHGGDTGAIIGGAMTGAAMAAFSAGAYGVAGVACTGISNSVGQATIYMAIGAYAGGMMSAMTGQDIGQGALIGGLSAGFSMLAGPYSGIKGIQSRPLQVYAARMAIGGMAGAMAATISGNDPFAAFGIGALVAAVSYRFSGEGNNRYNDENLNDMEKRMKEQGLYYEPRQQNEHSQLLFAENHFDTAKFFDDLTGDAIDAGWQRAVVVGAYKVAPWAGEIAGRVFTIFGVVLTISGPNDAGWKYHDVTFGSWAEGPPGNP